MSHTLTEIYERLFVAFGPQHWWPGETPFEVMVGAVLVQNTAWKNVERAIENLRDADLLEPHTLADVPEAELAELIRPAGYFRLKTRRLKNLLDFLVGDKSAVGRLFNVDVWHGKLGSMKVARSEDCPACALSKYEFLAG